MAAMPVVQLDKPLASVNVIGGYDAAAGTETNAHAGPRGSGEDTAALTYQAEQQVHAYQYLCSALEELVGRLNQLYDDIFAGHSEAIARLSVEIARKVLMQKIQDGDYEIESIIQEALKSAPENTGLVVRLNPQDLETFRQLQSSGETILSGFDLQTDPSIGRAECIIESSKGVIQLLLDEHLERISKALTKAR